MSASKKINSALISVYHKDGLAPVIEALHALGVTLYATGGTQTFIEQMEIPVVPVEDLTLYPSILGGRVKTLHPKIFGGILSRRNDVSDVEQLTKFEIPEIDLVIVDLYPFEKTVKECAEADALSLKELQNIRRGEATIIEKIDIGGISLIRAAAKNYNDVVIIPSLNEYSYLLNILTTQNGETTLANRKHLATKAFGVSSHYDTAIFNWFSDSSFSSNKGVNENFFTHQRIEVGGEVSQQNSSNTVVKENFSPLQGRGFVGEALPLRYGENPHQQGAYLGNLDEVFDKLCGKELSYNNLLDIDAAVNLIAEFNETTFAILKHNNACGCASRTTVEEAWAAALAGDPVSAFGGILITNATITLAVAKEINKLFFEVLIAPDFDAAAVELFKEKKTRILLKQKSFNRPAKQFRSILNGMLQQDTDNSTESPSAMKVVTQVGPTAVELDNLAFAMKICKNSKSNTIVLAENKQLIGSGAGMTSRVDALRHAIAKTKEFGFDTSGAVMASDAFFPFPDCVEIADNAGIKTVIQPGGSVKDQLSIDYCNQHHMAMVTTGVRHFKH